MRLFQRRWFMGACAGTLWFFIFSAGILIDSMPHREALGWKTEQTVSDAEIGQLAQQIIRSVDSKDDTGSPPDAVGNTGRGIDPLILLSNAIDEQQHKRARGEEPGPPLTSAQLFYHFLCGMVLFTPINVALLALLSGFIGGCASNEIDRAPLVEQINDATKSGNAVELSMLRQRMAYLQEHPISSMMRSFIVYLILISGLYVVSSDPFSPSTQSQGFTQYIRLAGLVSLLGFVVGYDPTRFKHWLDMVPSPVAKDPLRGTQNTTISVTQKEERTLEVTRPAEPVSTPRKQTRDDH